MTERPILFTAPMVRALLDGSKTQTRRVVKFPWEIFDGCPLKLSGPDPTGFLKDAPYPYGQPGDRLWVREAWAEVGTTDPGLVIYRADYPACVPKHYENVPVASAIKWKPSIHQFRKDSRITLEITSVRVERLQDISRADAIAEGAPPSHPSINKISRELGFADFSRSWYGQRWDQINGPGSWAANPWVWVVGFRVIKK